MRERQINKVDENRTPGFLEPRIFVFGGLYDEDFDGGYDGKD